MESVRLEYPGYGQQLIRNFGEFLIEALEGATYEGAIGVHVRGSLVLLTEERKGVGPGENRTYRHKLASWHVDSKALEVNRCE